MRLTNVAPTGRPRFDGSPVSVRTARVAGTGLLVAGLLAGLVALPRSEAGFVAVTDNPANVVVADTLEPPTMLSASNGGTIRLDWTATADTYADGYRVMRSSSSGGPYVQVAELTPDTTVSYQETPPYATHYYVVRSFAGAWESADSNEAVSELPFDCPADPDLRACIRFDTDLGGSYADDSAYGNTVIHSGGSLGAGVTSGAAQGSPTARYEMADSASLDLTTGMTIETWARFDSLPASGRDGLFDKDGQYSLILYAGTGLRCSNGLDNLPHLPVPVGVWFHAACAWDGSTLTLYIDGQPVASMASTGTMDTTNTEPIGLLNTSPEWDEPMDGAIDNLRVWHVGRTQAQICADAGLVGC